MDEMKTNHSDLKTKKSKNYLFKSLKEFSLQYGELELFKFYDEVIHHKKLPLHIRNFTKYLQSKKIDSLLKLTDAEIAIEHKVPNIKDKKTALLSLFIEHVQKLELAKSYLKHVLFGNFIRGIKEHELQKKYVRDLQNDVHELDALPKYYSSLFEAEHVKFSIVRNKRKEVENIDHYLDTYYLTQALKIECERLNKNYVLPKEQYINERYNQLVANFSNRITPDNLLVYAYYQIYQMLALNSVEHFEESYKCLTDILSDSPAYVLVEEKETIIDLLINFCIRKFNEDEYQYFIKFVHLFKIKVDQNLVKSIPIGELKTYIAMAVKTDSSETELLELLQFLSKLAATKRKNPFVLFNEALIRFERGNILEAINVFEKINSESNIEDIFYDISYRKLELRMDYVNWLTKKIAKNSDKDLESMQNKLRNLDILISKNFKTQRPKYYQSQIEFVQAVKKLLTIKLLTLKSERKDEYLALEEKLNNTQGLYEKEWFLKIIEEQLNL
jgi:hypothetical protein